MYLRPPTTYGSLLPGSEYIRALIRQGISAQTFYGWKSRFDPEDLTTLEAESRRPQRVRQPQTPIGIVEHHPAAPIARLPDASRIRSGLAQNASSVHGVNNVVDETKGLTRAEARNILFL